MNKYYYRIKIIDPDGIVVCPFSEKIVYILL